MEREQNSTIAGIGGLLERRFLGSAIPKFRKLCNVLPDDVMFGMGNSVRI